MSLKRADIPRLKAFVLKAISTVFGPKGAGLGFRSLWAPNRRKRLALLIALGVCTAAIWALALLLWLAPNMLVGPGVDGAGLAEVTPGQQPLTAAPSAASSGRPTEDEPPDPTRQTSLSEASRPGPTATRPRPPATRTPTPSPSPSLSPAVTRTASPTPSPAADRPVRADDTPTADRPEPPTPLPATALTLTPPARGRYLLVNQDEQRMYVYENGREVRQIKVSTGQPVANAFTPAWRGKVGPFWGSAPFRNSDLWADYIWYLFPGDQGSILIHSVPYTRNGNTKVYDRPEALGVKPASRGCIRISPEDAEWLAGWNPVGVLIEITPWSGQIGPADETLWPNG